MRRYVIIGMGPAGICAAQAIRGCDSGAQILLVGDDPFGYYSRPGLAYYLTGEIPEKFLFPFKEEDYRQLNLQRLGARAVRIDPARHLVHLSNGKQVTYDRLLLATGAAAQRLGVPGENLQGVLKLDSLEDARSIHKLARHSRSAVVLGGGITALEIVEALACQGVKTHYFLRGDRYWSNVLDEAESRIIEGRLAEEKVQIHYHTEVVEILGKSGKVCGVRTKDGQQMACDLVGAAIGIRPKTELAAASGLKSERGILVNQYLQTDFGDIFAAGDVAEVCDPLIGKHILNSLWGSACEQGRLAGINMCSTATPYRKPLAFNVTMLAGVITTIIGAVGGGRDEDLAGIARGDSEIFRSLPDVLEAPVSAHCEHNINRCRVMVGKQSLYGAIIMGEQALSQPLQELMAANVDISPIREPLLKPDAPVGEIIASFWNDWKERGPKKGETYAR